MAELKGWFRRVWDLVQEVLDIHGGAAIGLWTLLMAPACAYALYKGHDVPPGLSAMYIAVTSAYAYSRVKSNEKDRQD